MNRKRLAVFIVALVAALTMSSCALFSKGVADINKALVGVSATVTTYNEDGDVIDTIKGKSMNVTRDETFDTSNDKGESNKDSRVLRISVGKGMVQHVGSTLILAQDGITAIPDAAKKVDLSNSDSGSPFLNTLYQRFRNVWAGKSRTIMIRSQNGSPIAVYAGDKVETFAAGVPTATYFRVDDKILLVYRADYTVYDTALLG